MRGIHSYTKHENHYFNKENKSYQTQIFDNRIKHFLWHCLPTDVAEVTMPAFHIKHLYTNVTIYVLIMLSASSSNIHPSGNMG